MNKLSYLDAHVVPLQDMKTSVNLLLHGVGASVKQQIVDSAFRQSCVELMDQRNCLVSLHPKARRNFIDSGICIAGLAYHHLEHSAPILRKLICIYTTYLIWIDDSFIDNTNAIDDFNIRFVCGQPQITKDLDDLVALLKEIAGYYDTVSANLLLTSTMNFVTSLIFDFQMQGIPVHTRADAFLNFKRVLSGASEAYAVFIFPPHIPVRDYIQALLNMMTFLNFTNDVLSLYKEEDAGETLNHLSLVASTKGIPKQDALMDCATKCVEACNTALDILKGKESFESFQLFIGGYTDFHVSCERYRLHELGLEASGK